MNQTEPDPPDLRILIVDDSALYRQAITAALREVDGVQIVGTAKDGQEAIEKIELLKPDLLTLDVEMPIMNGIETLREMNRLRLSARAIMVSSLTEAGAKVTLDALYEGAFDFIAKPSGGLFETRAILQVALAEKFDAFRSHQSTAGVLKKIARSSIAQPSSGGGNDADQPCRMVVIGTSTGGPKALRFVLPRFDADFPVPIVVVQHMPPDYTGMMARRMNEECNLPVVEVAERQAILPGTIYIAPGGKHLQFTSTAGAITGHLTDDPPENSCRPAVDYTLRSAVDVTDGQALAVIMTGMGKDGMLGCQRLKDCGGTVYTQDAESSAVYGMPKSVVDAGLSDRELPLGKIAAAVTRHVYRRQAANRSTKTGGTRKSEQENQL
ncbi:Chemotaxis response regulator protein-glutamate methylesterase [Rubripirellula obstinata]|uniref:Protein-glutamate methylesterase/protein-glutamine glutaminase n=1 Tax=Rubripirellula obstinata TaxID=406547 RepID=A0A5B1CT28_9BACT|nr:chemotaxis response regulator protein-glutamate methylesterase [Rubripirellula obstinata]KAA1262374.1 Chemotaxis response regulator protein-glutamate methylesterase [Rubripirellula obstinata]